MACLDGPVGLFGSAGWVVSFWGEGWLFGWLGSVVGWQVFSSFGMVVFAFFWMVPWLVCWSVGVVLFGGVVFFLSCWVDD